MSADGTFVVPTRTVAHYLNELHYLGGTGRGFAWSDEYGVLVLAKPTARRLPQDGSWLELVRWCLTGERNGGSRQWARVARWLRAERPETTTIVSYSDPSVGHTGALYKACNWTWAPTWHRLFPPPTGNGSWSDGEAQAVKDRWIYVLRPDARRDELLRVKDGRAPALFLPHEGEATIYREALERVAAQQPATLAMIERNGFVFTSIGREPGNWQHLAFSVYTDLCEVDTVARQALHAADELAADAAQSHA